MGGTGGVEGNRLVLFGALVYLLEWAAIIPVTLAGDFGPFEPGTHTPEEMVTLYAASAERTAFLAAWLSAVLLGRIIMILGIRSAVRPVHGAASWADAAVAVMAVSVAIEVVAFSLVPGIGFAAAGGAEPGVVAALDQVAALAGMMVFVPVAASVLLASLAMRVSRLFPAWMCWLGLAAGVSGIGYGLFEALAYGSTGWPVLAAAITGASFPAALVWILATGIFLFRHAGSRDGDLRPASAQAP